MSVEIAVIVTTFERPESLRNVLYSLAGQREVDAAFEVVVSDDGSQDETRDLVEQFAESVDFSLRFTTHPHEGFRLARCRNKGVALTTAPYILFSDGDCVLPPDHLKRHLEHRKPGTAMAGYVAHLDREASAQVTRDTIRTGEYRQWAPRSALKKLRRMYRKAVYYNLIHHPTKPKLYGGNTAIWRVDFEKVNGYNEGFAGWGCEDDDLRLRLHRAKVRIESILKWTYTFHLWHPPTSSSPTKWRDGANVEYLRRPGRLTCCRDGYRKRTLDDMSIRVHDSDKSYPPVRSRVSSQSSGNPEVEILVLPGNGRFTGAADCNVLVVAEDCPQVRQHLKNTHILVADRASDSIPASRTFGLASLDKALDAIS